MLVVTHLMATVFMMGLIWFVQVVHYPLFAVVGRDRFERYEQHHQRLTSFVVGPPMAIEGVLAVWLFLAPPAALGRTLPFVGGLILAVVHASTVALQVPAHGRLVNGFDPSIGRRLVVTNWIRTIGWTARAIIAAAMVLAVG